VLDDDKRSNIVFRYSREERIKRAPQAVKNLEAWRNGRKRGFLAVLRGNKGLAMMMGAILIVAAVMTVSPLLNGSGGGVALGDYSVKATARRSEGRVWIEATLSKTDGLTKIFRLFQKGSESGTIAAVTSLDGKNFSRKEFSFSGGDKAVVAIDLVDDPAAASVYLALIRDNRSLELTMPIRNGEVAP
jgi:hypothetical protein